MKPSLGRRRLLQGAAGGALFLALPTWGAAAPATALERLKSLEAELGGQLGVWAIDTGNGNTLAWRSEERFAMCSTFKLMLVGAILDKGRTQPDLLAQRVSYSQQQLVTYSPVTSKHVATGMTVAQLCAAGLQYSDNTAANLLLRLVGGPAGLTHFARRLGDTAFRLDRIEPELNSALPDDPRDTTTPLAMGTSLQRLLLGNGLPAPAQQQLANWLKGNTTGDTRIRAGLPSAWPVGDKTGSGDFGVANDVGIIWPAGRAPWILAIYTRGREKAAPMRNDVIAAATRIVVDAWGR